MYNLHTCFFFFKSYNSFFSSSARVAARYSRKPNFAWWRQHFPNTVTMFTSARGRKRTFYFPPANCLISCCRWRAARRTVGGREKAQVGTGARTLSLHLSRTLRWLQASLSLWSFVEIPNSDIWRCLSRSFFVFSVFLPLCHLTLLLTPLQCLSLFVL